MPACLAGSSAASRTSGPDELDGSQPRPLLIMNVDIGDGRTGRLEVHRGDDCRELAGRFCATHSLPTELVLDGLAQQIAKSMADKGLLLHASAPSELPSGNTASSSEDTALGTASDDGRSAAWDGGGIDALGHEESARGRLAPEEKHALVPRTLVPATRHNAAFTQFAALEREIANRRREQQATVSTGKNKRDSAPDYHDGLYKRGLRIIAERKRVAEQKGRWLEPGNAGSLRAANKPRPRSSQSPLPGHNMRSRARSAPRMRPGEDEDADSTSASGVQTPGSHPESFLLPQQHAHDRSGQQNSTRSKESRKAFRPGGTPTRSAEHIRTQKGMVDSGRPKSAPRERPSSDIPVHERLFGLATARVCRVDPSRESTKIPWFAGGTHPERADRHRQHCTATTMSSVWEHSYVKHSWEEHEGNGDSIHERLYKEGLMKLDEVKQREEQKRNEDEEKSKMVTRRKRMLSEASAKLLQEKTGTMPDEIESGDILERLYRQGLAKEEERKRISTKRIEEQEIEARSARKSKFTKGENVKAFHPDVSNWAKELVPPHEPFLDRIDSIFEEHRKKDEIKQKQAELHHLALCPFRPKISKFASEQPNRDLKGNPTLHEALYQDAIEAQQKRKQSSAIEHPHVPPGKRYSSKEAEESSVERLCGPRAVDLSPDKSRQSKTNRTEGLQQTPWKNAGQPSPHWKWKLEPTRRCRSPDSRYQPSDLEVGNRLFSAAAFSEETRTLLIEQQENDAEEKMQFKARKGSTKILDKSHEKYLARIFAALGGDAAGYIRRNTGHLVVNLGEPAVDDAVAKVLLKHFKSSVQKVTLGVLQNICENEFRRPHSDGLSTWHKLAKMNQGKPRPDLQDSNQASGVEIFFEPFDDEPKGRTPVKRNNKTRDTIETEANRRGSVKSVPSSTEKRKSVPDFFIRLAEKNAQKEQLLENMRQQKIAAEMASHSFRPKSSTSAKKVHAPSFYDRMVAQERLKQEALEIARRNREAEALKECTFRPQVSRTNHSQTLVPSSFSNSSVRQVTLQADTSHDLSSIVDLDDLGSNFLHDPSPSPGVNAAMAPLPLPSRTTVAAPTPVDSPLRCAYRGTMLQSDRGTLFSPSAGSSVVIRGGRQNPNNGSEFCDVGT